MDTPAAILVFLLAGAEGTPPAATHLVWRDLAGLPAALSAAARAEVVRLYAPAGVRVEWVDLGAPGPRPLPVFVMDADAEAMRVGRDVMGVSRPRGDAAWIVYPTLLRTLGITRERAHRRGGDSLVGRALGRVVAHEVVHALALPHAHAERGLMRARLGRRALIAREIEWDDTTRRALVAGVLAAADAASVPSDNAAALAEDADDATGDTDVDPALPPAR